MGRMAAAMLCWLLGACEGPGELVGAGAEPLGEDRTVAAPVAPGPAGLPPALIGLGGASREAVRHAPVPVLLLPAEWAAASTVTAAVGFYAVSAREGELSVSLHATDVVHGLGDGLAVPAPAHEVRGRPARVLVNEGVRSVTWTEGATHYVLDVECYRPFEDARCTGDAFLLSLAEALVEVPR